MEKCVGCFLVYLFLGRFFLLKSVKNCDDVIDLENTLLPRVSVFLNVGKSISKLLAWLALKHATHRQSRITCSKSAKETLKHVARYV